MDSTHIGFDVPSGANVLLFQTLTAIHSQNVRFIFGGRQPAFRITRIVDAYNCTPSVDISFADAKPHDVTVFFAQNPLPLAKTHSFHIEIDNLSASTEPLQVTALYEPVDGPTVPPCGV